MTSVTPRETADLRVRAETPTAADQQVQEFDDGTAASTARTEAAPGASTPAAGLAKAETVAAVADPEDTKIKMIVASGDNSSVIFMIKMMTVSMGRRTVLTEEMDGSTGSVLEKDNVLVSGT